MVNLENVESEIFDFNFLRLYKHDPVTFDQLSKQQIRWKKLTEQMTHYQLKIARIGNWTDDEVVLNFTLQLLWVIEGGVSFYINWILYTLVKCDNMKIKVRKKKYIEDLYDLNFRTLSDRLELIRDNGFYNFALLINPKIRNAIAHVNYEIENGCITFYDRYRNKIDTMSKQQLLEYLNGINSVIRSFGLKILQDIDTIPK